MRIKFIEENSLIALKSNLPNNYLKFADPENGWIFDYFGRSPFLDTKFKVDDFSLDMSKENPVLTEFENTKKIYEKLKFLSESEASDERLWAGLCLTHFWKYVQYRWNILEKCTINNVEQHFFFGFGARRSLNRNAIARLWWIGRLTIDKSRDDPYELTRFVCENSDTVMHILERNTSNNPMIIRAFLSAILFAKKEGFTINTNIIGDLSKYLNLLGGVYILDCLSEEKIYNKILVKARSYKKE